jgi:aryl-alcohol dehydrogenase-like predicted oxidoreductase
MAQPIPDEKKVAYNFLGASGIKVSNISLGCATFGEVTWGWPDQCNEDLAHQIINRYVEWGGNFLDTADVYAIGNSETFVGKWLESQPREKIVLATKCRGNMGVTQNINNVGLSRRHITESIQNSLQRLHTDFVDLYQIHGWDNGTRAEETLRTLDDLVRAGKVRYVGLSNVTGWQMQKLVDTTERYGLNPIVSLQQQYSLASRDSELEPFQVCKASGVGILPWSPLKGGLLTGKVKRGVKPTEGRLAAVADKTAIAMEAAPHWDTFDSKTFDILDVVTEISEKRGHSIPQVALRWLLQKDIVSSVIIGAKTIAQLDDNMGAANGWSLTKEEMKRLDDVSAPTQGYPHGMVNGMNVDRVNPAANNVFIESLGD